MKSVMTIQKTKEKAMIMQAVSEVLQDPDFGLEIRRSVKQRLLQQSQSREKNTQLSEIKKKYL